MRSLALLAPTAVALLLSAGLSSPAFAAQPPRVKASSVQKDDAGEHPAELAFDGLLGSAWVEGQDGAGKGAWIEIDLRANTQIDSFSIWPGNLSQGKKSYREYSRPHTISVSVDGKALGSPMRILDEVQRLDIPVGQQGRVLRVTIDEVYEGFVFTDCAVAELAVNYVEAEGAARVALEEYLASDEGQAARKDWLDELEGHYQAHKRAEFGAPESLAWIMDAAGDGAHWLREPVQKRVPMGSRAQALHSDKQAIDALRKLKDANSIPAFEMAQLRATGDERAWLEELVEIFYAYQELIGGGNPNVPYWGETGWSEGAMQSFGEPIPIVVDRFGSVYVADVGNNRVQRFADNGRPDRVWGGPPDIADTWFGRGRDWYVSGSAPGDGPGQFHNPIAVELIPQKEMDLIAILDAERRVQIFDPDGHQLIGWHLNTDREVEPALGGEGHLAWLDSKGLLYAFFGSEAIAFDIHGQELLRFDIEDGTPNDVLAYKGKFLLVYRDAIVRYEADGFRDRIMWDMDDFDQGYEDVDLALDEEGRIWAVTDTGRAFKFKRPGKLEFQVDISEYSLEHPRFCVRDGLLHATDRDRIIVIDALQKRLDEEEAALQAAEEAAMREALEDEE
jgi:hypothetical protein